MLSAPICYQPWPFVNDLASDQIFFFSLRIDNLIVVEFHKEVWLKDFEIDGGVVCLTLAVSSVENYVMDPLIDKVLFPFGQPDHKIMA